MTVIFTNHDLLTILWDAMWATAMSAVMFHLGRRYERRQQREQSEDDREPIEPTL